MIRQASIAFSAGALITVIGALVGRAPAEVVRTEARKTACDQRIEEIDRKIAFHQKRFDRSGWWIDLEEIALAHLYRAHLTGSFRDYLAADRALELAFEKAEPNTGPFLARARVSFALHRFDRAEADLERADSAEMRADLLLHRGRYREAEAAYEAILAKERTPNALARLAHYRWKTGDFDAAESLLTEAIARAPKKGEPRAWLELQRGQLELSRGRIAQAEARFETADSVFGGWYLVEQHLAEAAIAAGDRSLAIRRYQSLADRTGNPEHTHSLANLLEESGQFARAAELHRRSKELFREQIALSPEAFSAHALSHLLSHGDAPGMVETAEQNYRARPNAESLVLLAQAYASAGRIEEAAAAIRSALATPISTAELHATAACVLAAAGDRGAGEQARIARSIRPSAIDDLPGRWCKSGTESPRRGSASQRRTP